MNRVRRALAVQVLALAWVGLTGCIRRIDLTPQAFDRWHAQDPDLDALRVYPDRRLLSYYPELGENVTRDVKDRKVIERGAKNVHKRTITGRTSGRIVAMDTLNGMPRLWVTFFPDCEAAVCAYGFVLTEHQRYSLVSVATLADYGSPVSYRRHRLKRNKLQLSRQRSVGEANEVLAAKRRKGKALPINLQLRLDSRQRTRTTSERAPGV